MKVHLNGSIVPAEQATLPFDDAGFQHAIGLFETMAAVRGKVFRLSQHLDRLARSAAELGLARQLDTAPLAQAVADTLAANALADARIRLTITPGSVSMLRPTPADQPPPMTVLVVATPPTAYDPAYFDKGITAIVASPGVAANPFDPMAGHKTLAYWSRLRTLRQAASVGAGEALWLNVTNHLASGSVSNLLLVKNGQILTPYARGEEVAQALPAPVLPGITRAAVLELAATLGIPLHRRMLTITDLLEADEVFLTNSSWHLLPVTRIEQKPIAGGEVGPITRQLRAALLDLIDRECD